MVLGDRHLPHDEYLKLDRQQQNQYHARRMQIEDQIRIDRTKKAMKALEQFAEGKIDFDLAIEATTVFAMNAEYSQEVNRIHIERIRRETCQSVSVKQLPKRWIKRLRAWI